MFSNEPGTGKTGNARDGLPAPSAAARPSKGRPQGGKGLKRAAAHPPTPVSPDLCQAVPCCQHPDLKPLLLAPLLYLPPLLCWAHGPQSAAHAGGTWGAARFVQVTSPRGRGNFRQPNQHLAADGNLRGCLGR